MPSHNHNIEFRAQNGATNNGWNDVMKLPAVDIKSTSLSTSNVGGNQPHNIMNPYVAINWIMKL